MKFRLFTKSKSPSQQKTEREIKAASTITFISKELSFSQLLDVFLHIIKSRIGNANEPTLKSHIKALNALKSDPRDV